MKNIYQLIALICIWVSCSVGAIQMHIPEIYIAAIVTSIVMFFSQAVTE